jgi:hypothetical protein
MPDANQLNVLVANIDYLIRWLLAGFKMRKMRKCFIFLKHQTKNILTLYSISHLMQNLEIIQ